LFRVDWRGNSVVLFCQRSDQVVRRRLCALQKIFLLIERSPLLELMNQAQFFGCGLRKDLFRILARLVGLFVRLLHLLDAFVLIAASVGQVAVGVVHVVGRNTEIGIGNVELILEFSLFGSAGPGDLGREVIYLGLKRLLQFLVFLKAGQNLLGLV